jgi:hypothetical protein
MEKKVEAAGMLYRHAVSKTIQASIIIHNENGH